jgi:hypothetical protein
VRRADQGCPGPGVRQAARLSPLLRNEARHTPPPRSLAAVPHWAPATSGIQRGIIRARARLDASTTSGPRHSQQPHVATFPGTRFPH